MPAKEEKTLTPKLFDMSFYDMHARFPSEYCPENANASILKYATMWMNLAILSSQGSKAERRKVGCAIITDNMGIYTGYNGTLPNTSNVCEKDNVTLPGVIHAEANALNKMSKEGISSKNSIVFITLSPCIHCAERLVGSGVSHVIYLDEYRDRSGVDFLNQNGVLCTSWDNFWVLVPQYKRK